MDKSRSTLEPVHPLPDGHSILEWFDESAARGVVLPVQDVEGQMRARWVDGDGAAGSAASALVSCTRNRRRLQNLDWYCAWESRYVCTHIARFESSGARPLSIGTLSLRDSLAKRRRSVQAE